MQLLQGQDHLSSGHLKIMQPVIVSSTQSPKVTLEISTVAKSKGVFVIGNKLVISMGIIWEASQMSQFYTK